MESRTALAINHVQHRAWGLGPAARRACQLHLCKIQRFYQCEQGVPHAPLPGPKRPAGGKRKGRLPPLSWEAGFQPPQTRDGSAGLEKAVKRESPDCKNIREIIQRSCASSQINCWCSLQREHKRLSCDRLRGEMKANISLTIC